MNKRLLVTVALCAFGLGNANAAILVTDTFSYPDGSLVPNGGWANHSGVAGDLMVASGQRQSFSMVCLPRMPTWRLLR